MSVKSRVSTTPNSVMSNPEIQHQCHGSASLAIYPSSSMSPQCWCRIPTTCCVLTFKFVYYESINRELKIKSIYAYVVYYESMEWKLLKPIYECRCNGRLQTKRFTRLAHTGCRFRLLSWILLWLDRKTPPPQGSKQWHNDARSPLSWSPDVQSISNPWCLWFHHGLNLRVSPRLRLRVKASL